MGRAKFRPEFVQRVRRLEFPQFFFLPGDPAPMDKDSVLLVYRITNVFEAHLEPTEWKLTEAVLRIL